MLNKEKDIAENSIMLITCAKMPRASQKRIKQRHGPAKPKPNLSKFASTSKPKRNLRPNFGPTKGVLKNTNRRIKTMGVSCDTFSAPHPRDNYLPVSSDQRFASRLGGCSISRP